MPTTAKGIITTAIGTSNDYAAAITTQSDGKLVLAGYSFNGTNGDFALLRYSSNGALDSSFDNDGKVTTPINALDDIGYSIIIQPDGKLIASGYSNTNASITNNDFALARYNSNGSLDTSFGNNGKVTTAIGAGNDYAYSALLQTDGKIIQTGYSYTGANNDFALARYNNNGSLDTSFGNNGKVTTAIGLGNDYAYSAVLQNDGKIIAAGRSYNGANDDFSLVRYNNDGSLDTGFGNNGKVSTAIGNSFDYARFVTTQADGKLLAVGYSNNGINNDFALVRYNNDGSLDSSFGNAGKTTTDFSGFNDLAQSAIIQNDGKIVLAGYSNNGVNNDFALARYNSDGSLDTSFGNNGKVTTDINAGNDVAQAIIAVANGKLVVTGYSWNGTNDDVALVRYNNDGSLDSSFDGSAQINHTPTGTVSFNNPNPQIGQVLIASNTLVDIDGLGSITYTWQSNGINVATGNSYTVSTNDMGKTISVTASYIDALGYSETVASAPSNLVTAAKLVLNGTAGDDLLVGNTGNDVLNGNSGNDLLDGDVGNDTINGGDGNDLIHGDSGNDNLSGNNGNDLLYGGVGNDIINGGSGNDILRGGTGKDNFVFNSQLATTGIDTISDFKVIDDTIQLKNSVFTALIVKGVLNPANFIIGTTAVDTNDFIIYNNNTGALLYDADANGSTKMVQIAIIGSNLDVTNADFVVV